MYIEQPDGLSYLCKGICCHSPHMSCAPAVHSSTASLACPSRRQAAFPWCPGSRSVLTSPFLCPLGAYILPPRFSLCISSMLSICVPDTWRLFLLLLWCLEYICVIAATRFLSPQNYDLLRGRGFCLFMC